MTGDLKLIVAIDSETKETMQLIINQLDPALCAIKIGPILFTRYGPRLVEDLMVLGFHIFLDLKFHDIPRTVALACRAAVDLGVWMLSLHIQGGHRMLIDAIEMVSHTNAKNHYHTRLLGITVLTSLERQDLTFLSMSQSMDDLVVAMAALGKTLGLDGVVCSAREAAVVRAKNPSPFLIVTPGIRLDDSEHQDQKRVLTPKQAMAAGADYLVVGRSITTSPRPNEVICAILKGMN